MKKVSNWGPVWFHLVIGGALVLFFARERRSVWLFVFLVQPSFAFFELYNCLPAISEVHRPSRTNDQSANYAIMPTPLRCRPCAKDWIFPVPLSKIGQWCRMRATFVRATPLPDFWKRRSRGSYGAYRVLLYLCTHSGRCKIRVSEKRIFDFDTYGNIVPWIKRGGFQLEASRTKQYSLRYSLSKFRWNA